MPLFIAFLLLAAVAPETTTGWMQPERLGVALGMSRDAAHLKIEARGWKIEEGKVPEHLIVRFSDQRSVTLAFTDGVLQSARFELVAFAPAIPPALREVEKTLIAKHGPPDVRIDKPTTLGFEKTDPRIYVTASTDPETAFGKQGLGFLVVRYFAPPPI